MEMNAHRNVLRLQIEREFVNGEQTYDTAAALRMPMHTQTYQSHICYKLHQADKQHILAKCELLLFVRGEFDDCMMLPLVKAQILPMKMEYYTKIRNRKV